MSWQKMNHSWQTNEYVDETCKISPCVGKYYTDLVRGFERNNFLSLSFNREVKYKDI